MPSIRIERKGFQQFEIGDCSFEVDVFRAYNKIAALRAEHGNGLGAEVPYVCELIKESGGPDCSDAEAIEFMNHIGNLTEEIGSFFEKKPSSQPSTDSTVST